MTEENEILIEKFIAGNLSEDEKNIFDKKMMTPEFISEVTFYKQLKTAAVLEGRNELRNRLKEIGIERSKERKPVFTELYIITRQIAYPIAASLIFFISVSIIYLNKSAYNEYSKFSKRGSLSLKIKS